MTTPTSLPKRIWWRPGTLSWSNSDTIRSRAPQRLAVARTMVCDNSSPENGRTSTRTSHHDAVSRAATHNGGAATLSGAAAASRTAMCVADSSESVNGVGAENGEPPLPP